MHKIRTLAILDAMEKIIEDYRSSTIEELIDAIDETDVLELSRPAAFVTGTKDHTYLYLNYSFDTEVFDLTDEKLDKATIRIEKDTGMATWYEYVTDTTVVVRIAVPRCNLNVGEYFSLQGTGTEHIKYMYYTVTAG